MGAYADRSNFKLYMGDTGLLVTQIMQKRKIEKMSIHKSLILIIWALIRELILENMADKC